MEEDFEAELIKYFIEQEKILNNLVKSSPVLKQLAVNILDSMKKDMEKIGENKNQNAIILNILDKIVGTGQ